MQGLTLNQTLQNAGFTAELRNPITGEPAPYYQRYIVRRVEGETARRTEVYGPFSAGDAWTWIKDYFSEELQRAYKNLGSSLADETWGV